MKKILFLPAAAIFSASFAFGQFRLDQLKTMNVRNVGPAGTSGRVTAIDGVVSNPDILYAGTASGGLWKTTSGGVNWKPIFDDQPLQSIGAVAVQQSNPDVVWAGTGEGNPRNSFSSGAGIYKSLDGGRTWKCMGLEKTRTIHRIVINPSNPQIVYAAAPGNAWGPNAERGVFRTMNGGETWDKVLFVNDKTGCADLVADPSNPDKLYAAMWEYGRKPWFFESGGEGSGLYVTVDGGKTWTKRTDKEGLPSGKLGRIGLAVARNNPSVVYALVEAQTTGLYRSDDGGYAWRLINDRSVGNRPFYYCEIYVDPQNENRIYNLWSNVTVSNDGGKTFSQLMGYGEGHPDHHAWWINPSDPSFLVDGNDGGLFMSRDRGETWVFADNIPVSQFYHVNYDLQTPYNLYGGMQDNGSLVGPAYAWHVSGIFNFEWSELVFGDGFDVVPQMNDPRYGYAMYQGGNLYRYDRVTGHTQYIQPVHPDGQQLRFNWNAGVAADPADPKGLYFGSQFLHHSTDKGQTWQIISPDLTTNDTTKQKQAKSGGITIDATRAENHTTIVAIAPSAVKNGVIWVGTDDGNVQLTEDGGAHWTLLNSRLQGLPAGAWIPHIEASPHDAGTAFVVANDYRRDNWQPYAWKTTDYGKSWKRIADEKSVKGHAHCIVQDPVVPGLLFLGTELGLWVSTNGGESWNQWQKEFPSVAVMDLAIHPKEADLIVATFGRSLWVIDDLWPLRELVRDPNITGKNIHVFQAPDAYLVTYPQQPGTHFPADGYYQGENRPGGARISFWMKTQPKKETPKPGEEPSKDPTDGKVVITIFNERGDTVRNFTQQPDTFLQSVNWDLNGRGYRSPSWQEQKPGPDDNAGNAVLPGTYKVQLRWGAEISSTQLNVLADPRRAPDPSGLRERDSLQQRIDRSIRVANTAFEQLKEMNKTVDYLAGAYTNLPKEKKDLLLKEGKMIQDSVKALSSLFLQPQDFKGYDHLTQRIGNRIDNATEHITSSPGKPSATAYTATAQVEASVRAALSRINAFTQKQWEDYKQHVRSASPDVFHDLPELKLD